MSDIINLKTFGCDSEEISLMWSYRLALATAPTSDSAGTKEASNSTQLWYPNPLPPNRIVFSLKLAVLLQGNQIS